MDNSLFHAVCFQWCTSNELKYVMTISCLLILWITVFHCSACSVLHNLHKLGNKSHISWYILDTYALLNFSNTYNILFISQVASTNHIYTNTSTPFICGHFYLHSNIIFICIWSNSKHRCPNMGITACTSNQKTFIESKEQISYCTGQHDSMSRVMLNIKIEQLLEKASHWKDVWAYKNWYAFIYGLAIIYLRDRPFRKLKHKWRIK